MQDTLIKLKIYEIRDPKLDTDLREFCDLFSPICTAISNWFNVKPSPYSDYKVVDLENSRSKSGASSKQLLHYA